MVWTVRTAIVKGYKGAICEGLVYQREWLIVVLEESVEVANAMGKLRSSEAKIVELQQRRHPRTAVTDPAVSDEGGDKLVATVSESI